MKNKLLAFIALILIFSCKEETKSNKDDISTESKIEEKINEKDNIFSVNLKVLVPQDDALEVFYLANETEGYVAERMVQNKIKGSNDFQEVKFDLPKGVYPHNVRLDFGFVKTQNEIKISECEFTYNDNSFVIKGSELWKYFKFNGGIEIQSDSLTFSLKPFDLHGREVHDPYIVGNKEFEAALMTKL